jgi:4a-hydroxytetrahydrobiopterin dehydratase
MMPSAADPHPEPDDDPTMSKLAEQDCIPRRGEVHRLAHSEVHRLLAELPQWSLAADGHAITRLYRFTNFVGAVAFVNALTGMAEAQDHHPDLEVGYGRCQVRYNTHDVGGLSLNDFICAARADQVYATQTAG